VQAIAAPDTWKGPCFTDSSELAILAAAQADRGQRRSQSASSPSEIRVRPVSPVLGLGLGCGGWAVLYTLAVWNGWRPRCGDFRGRR
jgi:hypothetical protein